MTRKIRNHMAIKTNTYKEGSTVYWKWGRGKIKGKVEKVYFTTIEKEIKGSKIKRNANEENPAYFIKEDNKDKYVLKLHSELLN